MNAMAICFSFFLDGVRGHATQYVTGNVWVSWGNLNCHLGELDAHAQDVVTHALNKAKE